MSIGHQIYSILATILLILLIIGVLVMGFNR